MAHRLTSRQVVPAPAEKVFGFFAEPLNLRRLTPSRMAFEFKTDDFEMREGLEIEYRLRALPAFPVTWRTLVTGYEPPHRFTDVQLKGPYGRWEHSHTFTPVDTGTLVEDKIEYELPFGPLGRLGHSIVKGELEQIFRHRARAIDNIFATPRPKDEPLTVAIAGGTGFVGGAIAQELHRRGHRPIVISHRGEEARGDLPDNVEIRLADVTGGEDLEPALTGADMLVVALAFENLPIEAPRRGRTFEQVDALGTERLVAAAGRAGVRKVVYMSGAGAAPDAERHWFRAKWRAEQAVRSSGADWTIIRPTWVYGPRDVSLNRFIGFARRLQMVPMTNLGRQQMAPVFVDDLANLAADSLTDPAAREQIFELGGPETMSMRRVIGRALAVAGIRRPIVPGPTPLIKLAALPLTLLPEPPLTPDAVDFVNQPATVDVGPLLARMPRRLTPFEEGLGMYLAPDSGPATLEFDRVRNVGTAHLRGSSKIAE
ncbi:MAG TPA: NAD(P)H-binding protein [Candidatus Limnocylindria bacterium]|nr:NAD(P)H-binding protein [Candidatus Limnocylindria bacterium]